MNRRWKAVLLSAIAWPGAGQLWSGRRGVGAAFALAAGVLGLVVIVLTVQAAVAAALAAPPPESFGQVVALARSVVGTLLGSPGVTLLVLGAVWVASMIDAALFTPPAA